MSADKKEVQVQETMTDEDTVLEMKGATVHFELDEGILKAVDGVDLVIKKGRTLGIVGESGSGKSVTAQAILRIVPPTAQVGGQILFRRRKDEEEQIIDLAKLSPKGADIRDIRGGEIAMIFQEPMKAFSPIYTIGNQIMEAILLHDTDDPEEAKNIAIEALIRVGMSNPEQRFHEYPHQLSGGMRQRAMIAMALSCRPSILIADEPTTALDVTVQAQVLQLINELKEKLHTSVLFITHDLGVIAEMADDVAVMYLGQVMEYTDVDTLFHEPLHPYTQSLLQAVPSLRMENKRLESIEGTVPIPINLRPGCRFYTRCKRAQDGVCNVSDVPLEEVKEGHYVRCLLWDKEEQNRGRA